MKRLITGAVLAGAAIFGFSFAPTRADVTTGYPYSYTLVTDLNAVGLSLTAYNIQNAGYCKVTVYGNAPFVGSLDVYTSVLGTFADAVKQSLVTTAGATYVNISGYAPKQPAAIRIQNRAYTSGDPLVGIDCKGGQLSVGPVPEPTPTATP